jgi:hypothetical protein
MLTQSDPIIWFKRVVPESFGRWPLSSLAHRETALGRLVYSENEITTISFVLTSDKSCDAPLEFPMDSQIRDQK